MRAVKAVSDAVMMAAPAVSDCYDSELSRPAEAGRPWAARFASRSERVALGSVFITL